MHHVILWAILGEVVFEILFPLMEHFVHALPHLAAMHSVHPIDISLLFLNHTGVSLTALMTAFAEEIRLAAPDRPGKGIGEAVHKELAMTCPGISVEDSQEDSPEDPLQSGMPAWGIHLVHSTMDAFKRGFIAVLTSYLGCVEHINDLFRQQAAVGVLLFFLSVFVGGPVIYASVLSVGRMLAHYTTPTLIRSASCCKSLEHGLSTVKSVLCAAVFIISAVGLWVDLNGSLLQTELDLHLRERSYVPKSDIEQVHQLSLWWQLPCGIFSVVIACIVGDYVSANTQCAPKLERLMPGVDWATATGNVAALVLGHVFLTIEAMVVQPSTRASLELIHASAGGVLSGYAGFAETVTLQALSGRWRPALMNWLINVGIGGAFCLVIYLTNRYDPVSVSYAA